MSFILDIAQFKQKRAEGKIARGEAEVAAKQEELAAVQREGDRKNRLAEALASQNASAGARGVAAFEGSPLTILQEDIRKEQKATERDVFQTKLSAMTTRARGRLAERQAKTEANIGLLRAIEGKATAAASGGAGGGA